MKTIRIECFAWLAVMACTAMTVTAADSVATRDGTSGTGSIVRLTAAGVSLSGGQTVAWTNVASVCRDRPALQAPGQRLALRNGTALCGLIRRATKDSIVFCSVAAGEFEVAWSNVSWVCFEPEVSRVKRAPDWTRACKVVKTDGTRRGGSLMMATWRQLLLKTSEGLEKIETGEVAWLLSGPPPARGDALTLRNGDRLCGPVTWRNETALVDVNEKQVEVDQSAIEQIGSR
jgi:hypothetical protein